MSADSLRSVRPLPGTATHLVARLYQLSLVFVSVAIFLLPFRPANIASAALSVVAGLLVASGVIATTIRTRFH